MVSDPDGLSAGFWEAARRHELVIQRCAECGTFRHYPQLLCPQCWSPAWSWTPVAPHGVVESYAIAHRAFHPAWAGRVPYAVVTATLDVGVRLVGDLPHADTARVAVGAGVDVVFDDLPGLTVPRFRLEGGARAGSGLS